MTRRILPAIFALLLILPFADADEVVLTGGSRLTGIVLEENPKTVRLLLELGDVVTLSRADVDAVSRDADAPQPGVYFRHHVDDTTEGLDVAVTHLVSSTGGPRIDLVGVIHVADPDYYAAIQKLLDREALVLYEAVKPKEQTNLEFEEDESENPLRKLHQSFARWFGLKFQLEMIDYDRPHFIHADMSAEQFNAEMRGPEPEPGEEPVKPEPTQLETVLKQFEAMLPMMDQMFATPGPMRDNVKKMMARMLGGANAEKMLGAMMPDLSELILEKRNKVVVEILKEHLEETEGPIAIFYGAAHMRDLEKRITEELGYRRAGARWLRAWDLGQD
jgi:hypothetical protein